MNLKSEFKNKTIIITGGTRGIGKSMAEFFVKSNFKTVIITGTKKNPPKWIFAYSKNFSIHYVQLDFLSKNYKIQIRYLIKKFKHIDICINNAGINALYPINKFPKNKIQQIIDVNLRGPILLIKSLSAGMKRKKYGRILNIASIFGVVSKKQRSIYSATKSGLIGLSRSLALELSEYNILVNCISPGIFDTELTRKILGQNGMKLMRKKIPLRKLGNPEWIAELAMFLVSNKNQYITGQNIIIDGGYVCE